MTWLITGVAGFIGAGVAAALLAQDEEVVGLDNLDPYYDPKLKLARLNRLRGRRFRFIPADITDHSTMATVFRDVRPMRVIHLAAQAGVRHALTNPLPYAMTNLMGFVHILEGCRSTGVEHLVFASSSSVYGETSKTPFSEHDPADHPVSLYAATKRSNEIVAHSYCHVYGVPATGLRLFTVYGPWGRPDMAYYAFAERIMSGRPITIFGDGSALRDFTYIDDIVEAVLRVASRPATGDPTWSPAGSDPATSVAPFRIYNVGRGKQATLSKMIELLEKYLGRRAIRDYAPRQPGDVLQTHADVSDLGRDLGFRPTVPLDVGMQRFVDWYLRYYDRAR